MARPSRGGTGGAARPPASGKDTEKTNRNFARKHTGFTQETYRNAKETHRKRIGTSQAIRIQKGEYIGNAYRNKKSNRKKNI